MRRRTLLTVIIVALLSLVFPAVLLAEERIQDAHWTVQIHTRSDGTYSAVGTLHLGSVAGGERQAWRIAGVEHLTDSSRLEFLKLLGTPVGPAHSATPVVLDVRIDYGVDQSPDASGRVKVKFHWAVDGVRAPAMDGTVLIKGKKITLKSQSVFSPSTGDEG
jgi:hypothetical protein